jgi:predicted ATPase/tetratricopeptide (TPR) repeat protein/DNA-binding XRE family transcriptional regulator
MDGQPSFGHWLRWRRRLLDLSREALAQQVGCAVVTIRKLESDERRPSLQIATRLAECLTIPPEERTAFITFARAEAYRDPVTPTSQAPELGEQVPTRQVSSLPIPLRALIGRKQDVAALRNRLLRADQRLLTVIGPPGIGKTRLALQVAHELLASFPDGVRFVALAAINNPALVAATIAQALDIADDGQPVAARLTDCLHTKRMLLVLDNFEQVVAAAPGLIELLEQCPLLKLLVTSRAPLRVRGEQLIPVPSLLIPHPAQAPNVGALMRTPAIKLFVERVQAVTPDFVLTEANAFAVAAICVRLDGLPLAIELIAARSRLLSPAALLARLDHQLTLLTDGPADVPARHRTLRSAIAWSYDLLQPAEQRLFRRLGVFVGGCTLEAVTALMDTEVQALSRQADNAVFAPHTVEEDVLDGLASLVNQSLLERAPAAEGESRFTMLETIREYAREQLELSGEADVVRRRYAAYFLGVAEAAEPAIRGVQRAMWLERLRLERGNIRVVLTWALAGGDTELGARIAGALAWFWWVCGAATEGRRWLEQTLACTETGTRAGLSRAARMKALAGVGLLALAQGDYAVARTQLEESAALGAAVENQWGQAFALHFLGSVLVAQGDHAAAARSHEAGLALFRSADDPWGQAWALGGLGQVQQEQGDAVQALQSHHASLTLFQSVGDRWGQASALYNMGFAAHYQGDYPRATACTEESLRMVEEQWGRAIVLGHLGALDRARRDYGQANAHFAESLRLARESGAKEAIAWALHDLGSVALLQGELEHATAFFVQSMARFRETLNPIGMAAYLTSMAGIAEAQGRAQRATQLFSAAAAMRDGSNEQPFPDVRRDFQQRLASVRTQLDTAIFDAAWAAGQAMSVEEAIACTLDENSERG